MDKEPATYFIRILQRLNLLYHSSSVDFQVLSGKWQLLAHKTLVVVVITALGTNVPGK